MSAPDTVHELEELLTELELLRDKIRDESTKWWWIDSGYAPLMPVAKFLEERKSVRIVIVPNQDVLTALDTIIENLRTLLKVNPKKVKQLHFKRIKEDIENLKKIIDNIRDADRLISQLEMLSKFADIYIEEGGEKVRVDKVVEEAIRQLVDRFKSNPLGWEKEREFFERIVKNLEKKVMS